MTAAQVKIKLCHVLAISSFLMAGNSFAKIEDAREVVKCQFHHENWLGKETHVSPVKVMVDDKRIFFVSETTGKVIRRARIGLKEVSSNGLITHYSGFFLSPVFPLTIWAGGLGGDKTVTYDSERSRISYSSYLMGAGERTFETYNVCDDIQGDESELAKLFPKKLRQYPRHDNKTIYTKNFGEIEVRSYDKPEYVTDTKEYISSSCQIGVDQEDQAYKGGDAYAVQNWTLYTGYRESVSTFLSMCSSLVEKFKRDYVGGLEVPPDHVKVQLNLNLFLDNAQGMKTSVGKVETIEGLKTISYQVAGQDENEIEWICRMNYRQADLSPGGSSYAEMKWMLTGNKQSAVEACNNLLRQYKTLYISKLDNPINNEKSILVQVVDQEDVQE